jgi:hypothetical protein
MAKYISPHLLLHFGVLISALGLHWLGSNFGWMTYKNSQHLLIAGIVAAALVALQG